MNNTYREITEEHRLHESAWQAELVRLFGKRAGDVRYTVEAQGAKGSKLAELYAQYAASRERWYDVTFPA